MNRRHPIFSIFLLSIGFFPASAQTPTDNQIKAAYIYNFIKNITWTDEGTIDTFKITVYKGDTDLLEVMKNMEGLEVRNKPVHITNITQQRNLQNVQLIFLPEKQNAFVKDIFEAVARQNILLVTDRCEFQRFVMLNFVYFSDSTIRFEINSKNIEEAGLISSPKLILLGGSEIDVRKLYLETEKTLVDEKEKSVVIEKELIEKKNQLAEMNGNLGRLQKEIESIRQEVAGQKATLNYLTTQNAEQQQKLDEKNQVLSDQKKEMERHDRNMQAIQKRMSEYTVILDSQRLEIKNRQQTITMQGEVLSSQESKIRSQQNKIQTQRNFLILSLAFILVALSLIVVIYRNFRINRKRNLELEKLSIVARETDNAVIITDGKGKFEWMNEGFTRIFGYTLEQFIEAKGNTLIEASTYEHISSVMQELFINKKSVNYEAPNINKNGEQIWVQSTLTPILNDEGSIRKIIVIDSDITKLKEAEFSILERNQKISDQAKELMEQTEELKLLNEELSGKRDELEIHRTQLEEIVRQRTAELTEAKDKAEESDRLKSAFLANMSHEIRTPLNAIIGFIDLIINESLDKETKGSYAKIVQSNSESLLQLINDILDLAQIESGQLKIDRDTRNLSQLISLTFNSIRGSKVVAMRKDLSFRLALPDEFKAIHTDELRFRQVLTNLIDNAIKYTERGTIEVGFRIRNREAVIFVKDTGIGIPSGKQQFIFERFTKIENPALRFYKGIGLGLAIVKKLVELLGGEIWVESEEGKGSCFYFTQPLEKKTKMKENKSEKNNRKGGPSFEDKTILICEDDDSNYLLLERILAPTNALLHRAKNGQEAIDYCSTGNLPDLILMDIKMPVMGGIEATTILKEKMGIRVPIVAQTAFATRKEIQNFSQHFDAYITKPILKNELFVSLNYYLSENE
jgi:PAS domain S-box-containing protein